MIKRIPVDKLRVGMFVHDLGCSWLEHPFLLNRVSIKTTKDLQTIVAAGLQDVYIDTTRGFDVDDGEGLPEAQVTQQVDRMIDHVVRKPTTPAQQQRSLEEELPRAQRVHADVRDAITTVFDDARLGKLPDPEALAPLAARVAESLRANPGALLMMARLKDVNRYTYEHAIAVGTLLTGFAQNLGYDGDELLRIGVGGLLLDIGKINVPEDLLDKAVPLSPEEIEIVKHHPVDSYALLSQLPGIHQVQLDMAVQHHERLDGSGYPRGLKNGGIARAAQLAGIADVYDALTSDGCFHRGLAPVQALRKLLEWSSEHFDPTLVQRFIRYVGIYPVGSLVALHSGRLGIVIEQNQTDLLTPKLLVVYDTEQRRRLEPAALDLAADSDMVTGAALGARWGINETEYLL